MIATLAATAADGVVCAARHSGAKGEAIIFVHGVGSNASVWDPQLKAFGEAYRCYAIDLRGNGVAPLPDDVDGAITREGFALDVLAVADLAKLDRFHFVGCSLGGVVGMELWRRTPARIRSFTLVDTFAKYPNSEQHVANITSALEGKESLKEFAEARAQALLPPNPPPERLRETVDHMVRKAVPAYLAATRATWTGDFRADLSSITVPTLVVWGEYDLRVTPRALSEELVAGIPGARLEIVKDAGHIPSADQPQAFNDLLRSFLREVSR